MNGGKELRLIEVSRTEAPDGPNLHADAGALEWVLPWSRAFSYC
jgi:hypothetical protein